MVDSMSASNGYPLPTIQPVDTPAVNEPSMEDILASIRRIIASDQNGSAARSFSAAPRLDLPTSGRETSVPEAEGPPLHLGAPILRDAAPPDRVEPIEHPGIFPGLQDLDTRIAPPASLDQGGEETLAEDASGEQDAVLLAGLHDHLFATASHAEHDAYDPDAVDPSSDTNGPDPLISSTAGAAISSSFHMLADTMLLRDPDILERIARETLRPMLKSWLDENLPSMVERLVRSEIERVARGGRSRD